MIMRTIWKRLAVLAAAGMMILSATLLCACEKRQVFENEPITLPLEKTYTLSYWLRYDNSFMPDYADFNDHPFYQWLESQTNIHIDFQVPTSTANTESEMIGAMRGEWMTLMAADSMTEMVEHYYFVPDLEGNTIDSAADEEIYYSLNEYIEVQMDNFKRLREQYAVIDKLIITPYNNIMYIPKLTGVEDENKEKPITQGLVIRKDFLDELQLDVPTTIDDWTQVLEAFQLKKGLAYPMMFGTMPLDATLEGDPFLSAYGVSYKFHIDKETGDLNYGCITDGMYQYVSLLNSWVTQGLMNTSVSPSTELRLSDDAGAFYATMDEMINLNGMATNPNYELVACPYPVLKEGDVISVYDTYMPVGNREVNATYITTTCESPALAAKWLDQLFSEEAFLRASYGEEGVDYTTDADGNIAFTEKVTGNEGGAIYGLYQRTLPTAMYCERDVAVDHIYSDLQKQAIETWSNVTRERSVIRTTSMNMTVEEEDMMSEFGNFWGIQTFALKDFINGGRDLSEWDAYLTQMNEAGIQEYIAIEQTAWDRYLAN